MNPAAADAFDETPAREHPIAQESRSPPPGVGTPVVYHCRHGEGRMMLQEFPAVIHSHNPDGTVSLIVDYDADDRIRVRSVGLRAPENDRPSYSLLQTHADAIKESNWNLIKPMLDFMGHRIDQLEAQPVKRGPGRQPKPKG